MRQETAAMRDPDPVYVRFAANTRLMSARVCCSDAQRLRAELTSPSISLGWKVMCERWFWPSTLASAE
jgi:hypothetical protein